MTEQQAQLDADRLAKDAFYYAGLEGNAVIAGQMISRKLNLPRLLQAEAERDELKKSRDEIVDVWQLDRAHEQLEHANPDCACPSCNLHRRYAKLQTEHAALLAVAVISESLVWLRSVKTEPTATVEALREALAALPKGLLEAERREA